MTGCGAVRGLRALRFLLGRRVMCGGGPKTAGSFRSALCYLLFCFALLHANVFVCINRVAALSLLFFAAAVGLVLYVY